MRLLDGDGVEPAERGAHHQTVSPPLLDLALCNGCGLCELSCGPDAIHVVDGKAVLDELLCEQCGLCISRCRPGALLWAEPA